jgi:dTDP-4-dehydrorhamnose reductase
MEIVAVGRPQMDLAIPGDAERIIPALSPDVVINAAAYTGVDQAEEEPELARRINARAAGEVAAAACGAGAMMVQISTDYVFDGSSLEPYDEHAPTAPLGSYGRSKLEGEVAAREAHPDCIVVRTAWVYSPFGKNFLKTMLSLGDSKPAISVVADQYGSPSSALALADGLLAMLDSTAFRTGQGLGQLYHLAGTGIATWFDFASLILEESVRLGGPEVEVRPLATEDWPTQAARPRNSVLVSEKFSRDFGFRMPPWQDSTREVVGRVRADAG